MAGAAFELLVIGNQAEMLQDLTWDLVQHETCFGVYMQHTENALCRTYTEAGIIRHFTVYQTIVGSQDESVDGIQPRAGVCQDESLCCLSTGLLSVYVRLGSMTS